jgi:hypothetical protein
MLKESNKRKRGKNLNSVPTLFPKAFKICKKIKNEICWAIVKLI